MVIQAQGKTVSLHEDQTTRVFVQNPMHVDFDHTPVQNATLMLYVEIKLNTVALWLVHSSNYQSTFEEAYQLCQSGYDFNLIVYEQPTGYYIPCYESVMAKPITHRRKRTRAKARWRRYWRRLWRFGRRQVQPKYRGEIMMVPGKSKWVEKDAGRFIVVPEGILRCNAASFAL